MSPLPIPSMLLDEAEVIKKEEKIIEPKVEIAPETKPVIRVENELCIRSGSKSREMILSIVDKCNNLILDLKTKYVLIGGCLIDLKPYCSDIWFQARARTCKNIYEVAQQVFNFCKSTTANIIGIAKRFGDYLCTLKKEYRPYSYVQLRAMLPLSDEQLKQVNPSMTEQEIKAISKQGKKAVHERGQNSENSESRINKEFGHPLTLKNDKERLDFLKLYRTWGLWLQLPELNLKFYRCNLNNGDFIVVTECPSFRVKDKWGDGLYYGLNDKLNDDKTYNFFKCIVKKGTSPDSYGFDHVGMGDTDFLTYMKSTKAKPTTIKKYENLDEYKKDMGVDDDK